MRNVPSTINANGSERRKKGLAVPAMLPRWLDISVDKLTSNRILLRGGGTRGRNAGRTGNILDTKRRRKVIENRSGLASSEAQLFRVFLRRSDVPLSVRHLPDKPAPSSWIRHIYSFATGAINLDHPRLSPFLHLPFIFYRCELRIGTSYFEYFEYASCALRLNVWKFNKTWELESSICLNLFKLWKRLLLGIGLNRFRYRNLSSRQDTCKIRILLRYHIALRKYKVCIK